MAKVNMSKMNWLKKAKLVTRQRHDTQELLIWNYSKSAQYEKYWTPETMMARGLITDLEGNIKARPFKKFFNLEEYQGEAKIPPINMTDKFKVYDKMDGSLGILYFIEGKPFIATRGSFTSDQAVEANKILQEKYKDVKFDTDYTYLFEIIYPLNRIVLDYKGMRDLVLLAVINTETGEEIDWTDSPFPKPESYNYNELEEIKNLMSEENNNKEGFVIKFENGERVKIKYTDYVRLHRLVTGISARRIWDLLRNHQSTEELLERVPEEFEDWVKRTIKELEGNYQSILREAIGDFAKIRVELDMEYGDGVISVDIENTFRKQFAVLAMKTKYPQILFGLLKDKYEDIIWKMIKPVAEKPFKDQSEEV